MQNQRRWGIVVLAVVMFFVTLMAGAYAPGRNANPFFLFVWIMVGWYAYKGDLKSIMSWMKILIWLAVVGVGLIYLFVGDNSSIGMSVKHEMAIGVAIMLIPKIGLFYYCKSQLDDNSVSPSYEHTEINKNSNIDAKSKIYRSKMSPKYNDSLANIGEQETIKIEDIFYENALEEFNLNRRSGAWIKILTENSGDEVKSKFDYIKLRAKELSIENRRIILRCDNCTQKIRVKNISGTLECPACKHSWFFDKEIRGGVSLNINEVKSKQQAGNVFINEIKLFFNSFNMLGYFSIGIVLLLILIEFIY